MPASNGISGKGLPPAQRRPQAVSGNVGDLLGDLDSKHGPSCTDAALRVLGLSFAGWNVIASLILAAIALRGAAKA